MKDKLKKLLQAKQEARTAKMDLVDKSDNVEELRGLQKEIDGINAEIRDIEGMVEALPKDEPATRTAAVNGEIPGIVISNAKPQEQRKAADEEGMEYRKAFQQYVTKGTPIPAELRTDATTLTTDIGSAIPVPVANEIIEKLNSAGMILPLVTKTSFPAGQTIPTSSVKPVATWVNEGAGSTKQNKTTGTITFTHHKLRCEVAMSAEASVMAIAAFEAKLVANVVKAMTESIEQSIISGAKSGDAWASPAGILSETVATGQDVEIGASAKITYQTLVSAEAALPLAYESGAKWFMTKKTFMAFIGLTDGTDGAGQPIARVNYGIDGNPERTLLGRQVILNDYMTSYAATLNTSAVVAFLFDPSDYVLNTNYNMGIQRKQDWDTEDYLTKSVMAVDGKVVDKNSLVTVTKKV